MMSPTSFGIGRSVLDETLPADLEEALMETTDMALAMKSPGTINRAGSLLLFVRWCEMVAKVRPFPITERDIAACMFRLRREGKFVSRGASLREALRFAHYCLGLDGALTACDSSRVKGASDLMLCGGGTWQPAYPLHVEEVLMFHKILADDARYVLDRWAAGNILVMIYGRCRASDLGHVEKLICD